MAGNGGYVDSLQGAMEVSASAMTAQSARLRVVAENMANARSTSDVPGGDPYTRKTVTFSQELDRASGISRVVVRDVGFDSSPYRVEYDPGNPGADDKGYVKLPNLSLLMEMADMREATHAYEAALQMVSQVRALGTMTIDLLKG